MERNTSFLFGAVLAASLADDSDRVFAGWPKVLHARRPRRNMARVKSPVAEGVIEQYILDPRGEVEGLLLADGSYMYVTSRAEKELLSVLTPGDRVRVYGRRTQDQGLIQADVIKNLTKGTSFVVPLRLDLPMQDQERRLSVTEMYAKGTIRVLLYHALRGIVQGMVLSDGTQIRLPPDTSCRTPPILACRRLGDDQGKWDRQQIRPRDRGGRDRQGYRTSRPIGCFCAQLALNGYGAVFLFHAG